MKIKEEEKEKEKNLINQDQLMNEKKDKKTEQMFKSLYQSKISKDVINNFLNIFNKYEALINLNDEEVYEDYLIKTTFKIIKNNMKNLLSKNQV